MGIAGLRNSVSGGLAAVGFSILPAEIIHCISAKGPDADAHDKRLLSPTLLRAFMYADSQRYYARASRREKMKVGKVNEMQHANVLERLQAAC